MVVVWEGGLLCVGGQGCAGDYAGTGTPLAAADYAAVPDLQMYPTVAVAIVPARGRAPPPLPPDFGQIGVSISKPLYGA